MNLRPWVVGLFLALPGPAVATDTASPTVDEMVSKYLTARGGADRWRRLESLEIRGVCATFSQKAQCVLRRQRGDLYRLDYHLLGSPAVRARDEEGAWMLHPLLKPEAGRVGEEEPYAAQLEREALFEPPLLDYSEKSIQIELLGPGDVDGHPTLNLRVVLPSGEEETWYLDPETFLEVAIDSQVVDFTQAQEPMRQRVFFEDFREVEGLFLPFRVEMEFGARLESLAVESVEVDSSFDESRPFRLPEGDSAGPSPGRL